MTEQQERRARIVKKAIDSIEKKLGTEDVKHTLTDLVRLLQIEKELEADEPREVRVQWVESSQTASTGTE